MVFNQELHTYHLDGVELSGVTGMLHKTLFADKYAGISEETLKKAAAYGTSVHEAIELYETCGIDDGSVELQNYKKLKETLGLNFEASEYLISDEENIASSIDGVYTSTSPFVLTQCGEKEVAIVLEDTKTTYNGIDRDYLSWLLSIYAHYFEKQNPGLHVGSLVCFWLRKEDYSYTFLFRHSDAEVEQLVSEFAAGVPCTVTKCEPLPMKIASLADAVADMERTIKTWTAKRDELKEKILQLMKDNNCDKVELDGRVLITRVAPTTREAFDGKAFKEAQPELYKQYVKTSEVKESLKITVRETK